MINLIEKEAMLKKRSIDEQAIHWIRLGRTTEFKKRKPDYEQENDQSPEH